MFTDISNFTKLSEVLNLSRFLSSFEYQTKMVAAVFQNGGSADKFIGDSVMATFGTSIEGNDAQNALNCIRQMQIPARMGKREVR